MVNKESNEEYDKPDERKWKGIDRKAAEKRNWIEGKKPIKTQQIYTSWLKGQTRSGIDTHIVKTHGQVLTVVHACCVHFNVFVTLPQSAVLVAAACATESAAVRTKKLAKSIFPTA